MAPTPSTPHPSGSGTKKIETGWTGLNNMTKQNHQDIHKFVCSLNVYRSSLFFSYVEGNLSCKQIRIECALCLTFRPALFFSLWRVVLIVCVALFSLFDCDFSPFFPRNACIKIHVIRMWLTNWKSDVRNDNFSVKMVCAIMHFSRFSALSFIFHQVFSSGSNNFSREI